MLSDQELGESLPSTTLVLLPGLDGTGNLFANFVSALKPSLDARIVRYPTHRLLTYTDLFSFVLDAVPQTQPFVLLAESFSTPLAVRLAATNPANLKGLVICAGFIRNPLRGWLGLMGGLVHPFLFRIPPPRFVINHFLIGEHAPRELQEEVRRTLRSVSPEVVALRVRVVMACDASDQLVQVRVPMLYLQAEQDRLVRESSFQEIHELKADTVLASVTAPHFILQREPRKAVDLITHFVDDLPS
jgi:pimeloyl-[acyl-carrier protein] methyl ester esterase